MSFQDKINIIISYCSICYIIGLCLFGHVMLHKKGANLITELIALLLSPVIIPLYLIHKLI